MTTYWLPLLYYKENLTLTLSIARLKEPAFDF